MLAALLWGFLAQLTVLGSLQHGRSQQTGYAQFRDVLAKAQAPVGSVDDAGYLIAPGTPVAIITIPRIDLREVVGEGTTGGVLAHGPGHRRDTVLPGQPGVSVLMGRRAGYGGPFARIGQLRAGDLITVTTGQGVHTYTVLAVRHPGDPQPQPLRAGQGRLTLMTADGPAFRPTDVLRADAALKSEAQPGTRPAIATTALPVAERAMASDDGVLVPLVLWAQVLMVAAAVVAWIRHRVGRWHAWIIGVAVLGALGVAVADHATGLLPNLL